MVTKPSDPGSIQHFHFTLHRWEFLILCIVHKLQWQELQRISDSLGPIAVLSLEGLGKGFSKGFLKEKLEVLYQSCSWPSVMDVVASLR